MVIDYFDLSWGVCQECFLWLFAGLYEQKANTDSIVCLSFKLTNSIIPTFASVYYNRSYTLVPIMEQRIYLTVNFHLYEK